MTNSYRSSFLFHARAGRARLIVGAFMEMSSGKITQVRHYIDKLEAAKQMASGAAKLAVSTVAKQVEALVNP